MTNLPRVAPYLRYAHFPLVACLSYFLLISLSSRVAMLVWMKVVVVIQTTSSKQIEMCGFMQIKVYGVVWAEARWCYRCGVKAGSIWNGYGRSWK